MPLSITRDDIMVGLLLAASMATFSAWVVTEMNKGILSQSFTDVVDGATYTVTGTNSMNVHKETETFTIDFNNRTVTTGVEANDIRYSFNTKNSALIDDALHVGCQIVDAAPKKLENYDDYPLSSFVPKNSYLKKAAIFSDSYCQ